MVELLIKKGADKNALSKYYETPLALAIRSQREKSEVILRKYGAKEQ